MATRGDVVVVDGQKLRIDGNGLRTPTDKERQKGLPTSAADAQSKGLNVYQVEGEPAKIMRFKTRKKPDELGLQAEHENFALRKDNRFGSGGAGKNKRGDAEKLASPDPKVRSETNRYMGEVSAEGKAPHHGLPVSAYAKGKQEAINRGGVEAGELFDKRYSTVIPGGAHSKGNIYSISISSHDFLHNVQEPEYFKSIKQAGTNKPIILGELPKNNGNGNGNGNGKDKVNGKTNGSGLALKAKDFKVGKVRLADQAINTGINFATGNYVGAAIGSGAIAMTETLKSKAAQKAIARQIATIAAKRGGKTALKLIPGLDILLSGKESWDYLSQGKLDQAGIAALSGAIGWIPVIGDGASAALDFTNTGLDLARLDLPNRTKKTKATNKSTRLLKNIKT